jgi:hypothetical protein
VNCQEYRDWLDQGRPEIDEEAARVHGHSCPACVLELRAAEEIEELLARMPSPEQAGVVPSLGEEVSLPESPVEPEWLAVPPPDFAARVMERVAAAGRARAADMVPVQDGLLPWWVRSAAQPAVVLSCLLMSLVFWRAGDLWRLAGRLSSLAEGIRLNAVGPLKPLMAHFTAPWVLFALCLVAGPALLVLSWWLYGWSKRICSLSLSESPRGL